MSPEALRSLKGEWTRDEVQPPGRVRLYRAVASEHFVLGDKDERLPVSLS